MRIQPLVQLIRESKVVVVLPDPVADKKQSEDVCLQKCVIQILNNATNAWHVKEHFPYGLQESNCVYSLNI